MKTASSTNNRKFETFKREFTKWQKKFGLNSYKIYFKHVPLDDAFANIIVNQQSMVATVGWNSNCDNENKPFENPSNTAKHEAIHLLIYRLENLAYSRFLDDTEIMEAAEDLTRRLDGLIT